MNKEDATEFASVLIRRGLGIYGRIRVAEICSESNVALLDDNTVDWVTEDIDKAVNDLIVNFSKSNLPAKMTAMVLAKKYGIPFPEELTKKKRRQSRFRRLVYQP